MQYPLHNSTRYNGRGPRRRLVILAAVLLLAGTAVAQENKESAMQRKTLYTLKNAQMVLKVDLFGGAYTDLHLRSPRSINPLTWKLKPENMPPNNRDGAPFQGHFLCLGRWGSPTEGEIDKGIPHNGQATNTLWKAKEQSDSLKLLMTNSTPIDGMHIKREVKLENHRPVFHVTEKITNTTTIARLNNVVQHVTLGPPFLDRHTTINANARAGFLQEFAYPEPARYEFCFPFVHIDSKNMHWDLRKTQTDRNYVTTHLVGDSIGWVTALQPEKNLVIGYTWKTSQYPWLNLWNQTKNQKPVAKGLEFGTTGIGRPYNELLRVPTRFHGQKSFELLDAGQTLTKTFTGFISRAPENMKAVERVEFMDNKIFIFTEKGEKFTPTQ